MAILENQRWELFAQGLAKGLTQGEAYVQAGHKPSPSAPSRLFENVRIKGRVQELIGRQAVEIIVTKQYVTEALVDNLEKALGRKPVKIGEVGKEREVFVYRGDVANRAIQLAGIELQMFTERKEIKHLGEFQKLSNVQLVELLTREAQALLLSDQNGGRDEGNGEHGA
jgi:hypothetical protein